VTARAAGEEGRGGVLLGTVRVAGRIRDRELTGYATIALRPPNLEIEADRRLIVLRLASLAGVEDRTGALAVHLAWGDVIELHSSEPLHHFTEAIAGAVLRLPELTASLRSYGSSRAGAGEEQDAFFAPLRLALAASARGIGQPGGSFAADRLAADLRSQIAQLASSRFPTRAPERRALEAELGDRTGAVGRRLDLLRAAEMDRDHAPASRRFAAWRQWSEALTDVFNAHDACWAHVRSALAAAHLPEEPEPQRKRWSPFGRDRGSRTE
jgi:hypothetical protein